MQTRFSKRGRDKEEKAPKNHHEGENNKVKFPERLRKLDLLVKLGLCNL